MGVCRNDHWHTGNDYSCPVPLYKFKEARLLSGELRLNDDFHWTMDVLASHEDEMAMQAKFPDWNRQHSIRTQPIQYARLLAKIAFAYAVAEYGLDGFTPTIQSVILGHSDDCFAVVGGTLDVRAAIPGGDHITNLLLRFRSPTRAFLVVELRLFSQMTTPEYHVVVGEVDLEDQSHRSAFEAFRLAGRFVGLPDA